jgi:mono/diheme cytochrome c family protein
MRLTKNLVVAGSIILAGCTAGGNYQGREYAPNMYHSVAYEPLSQITDKDAGRWVTSIDYPDGHAEYYNSSKYNGGPNVRVPPANTVRRNSYGGWLPYRLPADSVGLRLSNRLTNPFDTTAAIQGKVLYEMYCDHCHGPKGKGDGKVASGVKIDGVEKSAYNGVANLTSDALKNISEGHIFHVITYGKGLMWAHGSQVSPEDRWRIAKYVKTLQK